MPLPPLLLPNSSLSLLESQHRPGETLRKGELYTRWMGDNQVVEFIDSIWKRDASLGGEMTAGIKNSEKSESS